MPSWTEAFQGTATAEQLREHVVKLRRAGMLGGGQVLGLSGEGRGYAAPSGITQGRSDEHAAIAGAAAAPGGVSAGFIRGDEIVWVNVSQRRQSPAADANPLSRYTSDGQYLNLCIRVCSQLL